MRSTLAPCLERIHALPFVESIEVDAADGGPTDTLLAIQTPTGTAKVYFELKTSNMSREMAAHVVALAQKIYPLLVAAPVIGAGVGDYLAQHKTSFVDLRGNCYIDLGGKYVARIQGQRSARGPAPKALRTPSYQLLFAVLANPSLISAPVRTLAEAAGVSRQPVMTLRQLLEELGLIVRGAKGYVWAPQGQRKALDLWLAGYATSVRPGLLVGTYRTQDATPIELENRIKPILDGACSWRWGGGAASLRLTQYYRGERTIVHVQDEPSDLQRRLRVVPAADGPMVILRTPGPLGLEGATPDTAHPLLVYTELLTDGSERAREAAQELDARFSFGKDA